jgi:hypothetical protein
VEVNQLNFTTKNFYRFCWRAIDVRTLGGGIPTGMSDMHAKMVDYYHHCQDMELERRMAMAD